MSAVYEVLWPRIRGSCRKTYRSSTRFRPPSVCFRRISFQRIIEPSRTAPWQRLRLPPAGPFLWPHPPTAPRIKGRTGISLLVSLANERTFPPPFRPRAVTFPQSPLNRLIRFPLVSDVRSLASRRARRASFPEDHVQKIPFLNIRSPRCKQNGVFLCMPGSPCFIQMHAFLLMYREWRMSMHEQS